MGVFANTLSQAAGQRDVTGKQPHARPSLGAWLVDRLRRRATRPPRLALVERINLAPRQSIALIEADGQRLLVATSGEGAPSFYALKATGGRSVPGRSDACGSRSIGLEQERI